MHDTARRYAIHPGTTAFARRLMSTSMKYLLFATWLAICCRPAASVLGVVLTSRSFSGCQPPDHRFDQAFRLPPRVRNTVSIHTGAAGAGIWLAD